MLDTVELDLNSYKSLEKPPKLSNEERNSLLRQILVERKTLAGIHRNVMDKSKRSPKPRDGHKPVKILGTNESDLTIASIHVSSYSFQPCLLYTSDAADE